MNIVRHYLALLLSLAVAVSLVPPSARAEALDGVIQTCERAGLESGTLARIMRRLREQKLTETVASEIMDPACRAAQAGLPTGSLLTKIEEGLGKRVAGDRIAIAVRERLRCLERARSLAQVREHASRRGEQELVEAVSLALESGLPETVLQDVLKQSMDRKASEVTMVVQAGETLHLNGYGPEATRSVMVDCLHQRLRRTEVLRRVRYTLRRSDSGMAPRAVRRARQGSEAGVLPYQSGGRATLRTAERIGQSASPANLPGTGGPSASPGVTPPGGAAPASGPARPPALSPGVGPGVTLPSAPGPAGTAPGADGSAPGPGPGGQ